MRLKPTILKNSSEQNRTHSNNQNKEEVRI